MVVGTLRERYSTHYRVPHELHDVVNLYRERERHTHKMVLSGA